MPWNKEQFIDSVTSFLSSNNIGSINEAADEFSISYTDAATKVNPKSPNWSSIPINLKEREIIKNGFLESFNTGMSIKNTSQFNASVWDPLVDSIIIYWTDVKFTPNPPPPGGLTGQNNIITYPGNENKLKLDIYEAFTSGTIEKVADLLNIAFINHLSTITGTWIGTAPGSPPPPYTLQWSGLL